MKQLFKVKNMVCDRCIMVVKDLATQAEATVVSVDLGEVLLDTSAHFDQIGFEEALNRKGFEVIKTTEEEMTETIKVALIEMLSDPTDENLSIYLVNKLHKDYSLLSKSFKNTAGQTIEKFFINLRIEQVKESIQMGGDSFSEIAYQLGFRSIHHLSKQFKDHTGMTMSTYKDKGDWHRMSRDKIV